MKKFLSLLAAAIFALPFFAQSSTDNTFPSINLIPDSRITDQIAFGPETMDADTFIRTSFIASGATDSSIDESMAKLENHWDFFQKILAQKSISKNDKPEIIRQTLFFIHNDIFLSYNALQTKIDLLLQKGIFNCVSATAIFMYFMKRLDIPVIPVECPDHAFATVQIDGIEFDVETTNPYGFAPGTKIELQSNKPGQKVWVKVPASNYKNRKNVNDKRLLSMIYINRIHVLQTRHQDIETIPLAINQARLQGALNADGSLLENPPLTGEKASAIAEIRRCTANVVVDYSGKNLNPDVLDFALLIQNKFGFDPVIQNNCDYLITSHASKLAKQNQYEKSLEFIEKYKDAATRQNYLETKQITIANKLVWELDKKTFEENINSIEGNKQNISSKDYRSLISYAYTNEASRLYNEKTDGAALRAIRFSDQACKDFPSDSKIREQNGVLRHNYEAQIHNKIAVLVNGGKTSDAKALCESEIKNLGTTKILAKDLRRLSQMRN